MKLFFVLLIILFLALAGCASAPPREELVLPEAEVLDDTPTEPEPPLRKAPRAAPKKAPAPVLLPPCESVPGDKRAAFLQKLDCILESPAQLEQARPLK
jgi:hypothetical protein